MPKNPLQAYKTVSKTIMSGREIEAAVLMTAASKLTACKESWEESVKGEKLNEALRYDQMIWSVFQGELLEERNQLPREIRQQLLTLSKFVDKRIFDTMSYPAPEKLDILIKINTNLAAGLSSTHKSTGEALHTVEQQPPFSTSIL